MGRRLSIDQSGRPMQLLPHQLAALAVDPTKWFSPEIYRPFIQQFWECYARKPALEVMGKAELTVLVQDALSRFMKDFEDLLRKKHGKLDAKKLESKARQQKPFFLPGVDPESTLECLYYYFASECKMREGHITKASFFLHFPTAHQKLLALTSLEKTLEREQLVTALNQQAIHRATRGIKGITSMRATKSVKMGRAVSRDFTGAVPGSASVQTPGKSPARPLSLYEEGLADMESQGLHVKTPSRGGPMAVSPSGAHTRAPSQSLQPTPARSPAARESEATLPGAIMSARNVTSSRPAVSSLSSVTQAA